MKQKVKTMTREELIRTEAEEARTEAVNSLKKATHDLYDLMDDRESAGDFDTARTLERVRDHIDTALGYFEDYAEEDKGGRS